MNASVIGPTVPQQCLTCGSESPSAAYWVTRGPEIRICHWCALQVGPALVADSIPSLSSKVVLAAFDKMASEFWRALSLRLMRDLEDATRG